MRPESIIEKRERREKEWRKTGEGRRGDDDSIVFLALKTKWRKVR